MQLTLATVALAVFFAAASAAPQPPPYLLPGTPCTEGDAYLCFPGTQCVMPLGLPIGVSGSAPFVSVLPD